MPQLDDLGESIETSVQDRSPDRDSSVVKIVVKKLAKEMLKTSVPKQVWESCADEINKAFNIDADRIKKH